MRDTNAELSAFCALMEPLGDRVGGLTLQLPPSFSPADLMVLETTLRQRPQAWRWSVEVRHP
ncbi:MAG: DUF72 domain-containing protein, partial [Actinomycetota bacterium]|nr:DUF72 domain-containing protein [Actinomycetota bacterium]